LFFEMVYHASCGDEELAEGLAFELIQYARSQSPPLVAIRYLRLAAHVINCFRSPESAIPVLTESFDWAKKLNARIAMVIGAGLLSSSYMQNGDNDSAKTWIDCAFGVHNPADMIVADVNMWSYRAEIALRLRDAADAKLSLANCINGAEASKSRRSLVRYRSLQTHFMVLTGQRITEAYLNEFIALHDATKRSLMQDYTVESLILGLESVDRLDDAERFATEYVYGHRRARCPLPVPLALLISRLRLLSKQGD
jgi:hypothetical protein